MLIAIDYEKEPETKDTSLARMREIMVSGAAFVILFAAALQGGGKGFLLESSELDQKIMGGKMHAKHPHVVAPLMGRFKGEIREIYLFLEIFQLFCERSYFMLCAIA